MFNPVAALLQALITGWRVYEFIKDRFKQLFDLVKVFTESLEAVAKGALQGAMNGVEGVLARMLPLGIDLLARVIGLNKVSNAVNSGVDKIKTKADTAIDGFIEWLRDKVGVGNGSSDGGGTTNKSLLEVQYQRTKPPRLSTWKAKTPQSLTNHVASTKPTSQQPAMYAPKAAAM